MANYDNEIFDVLVIGGGPAGYVCAIRSAQLGLKTACIDKRKTLGGTCLNEGCIPSKFLLNKSYNYFEAKNNFSSKAIKIGDISIDVGLLCDEKESVVKQLCQGIDFLFKKNKITRIEGIAKFKSEDSEIKEIIVNDNDILKAKNVVIATGSESINIPNVIVDEKNILSSSGVLNLRKLPESLTVIGGGVIGLEMASVWSRLGTKVTVIEGSNNIIPTFDSEVSKTMFDILTRHDIKIHLNSLLQSASISDKGVEVIYKDINSNDVSTIQTEKLLISIGRQPYLKEIDSNVTLSDKGFIVTDNNCQTNKAGIYAIGDVKDGPMLAHKASEEGVMVAELIAGKQPHIGFIPSVIYTHPEAAFVGATEQALQEKNIPYTVGKFPFLANSRAKTNGDTDGFVKVIVEKGDKKILGVHIVGSQAGTMISEACLAMDYKAAAEDVAMTCHSHPDLPEAFKEAALQAFSKAIHI